MKSDRRYEEDRRKDRKEIFNAMKHIPWLICVIILVGIIVMQQMKQMNQGTISKETEVTKIEEGIKETEVTVKEAEVTKVEEEGMMHKIYGLVKGMGETKEVASTELENKIRELEKVIVDMQKTKVVAETEMKEKEDINLLKAKLYIQEEREAKKIMEERQIELMRKEVEKEREGLTVEKQILEDERKRLDEMRSVNELLSIQLKEEIDRLNQAREVGERNKEIRVVDRGFVYNKEMHEKITDLGYDLEKDILERVIGYLTMEKTDKKIIESVRQLVTKSFDGFEIWHGINRK